MSTPLFFSKHLPQHCNSEYNFQFFYQCLGIPSGLYVLLDIFQERKRLSATAFACFLLALLRIAALFFLTNSFPEVLSISVAPLYESELSDSNSLTISPFKALAVCSC